MDEASFLGYLVIGLVTLIGLFMTVGKPIMTLNTNIIKLSMAVERLQTDYEELKNSSRNELNLVSVANTKAHERINDRLDDHEIRIHDLEHKTEESK